MNNLRENLCRTCLSESDNMFSLFTTTSETDANLNLSVMLTVFTSIQLDGADDLPHSICEQCITMLNLSYNFKLICEKSNKILLNDSPIDDVIITDADKIELQVDEKIHMVENSYKEIVDITNQFKCEFCDKIFIGDKFLANHKKKFHQTTCEPCKLEFMTRKQFLNHEKIVHPKPFSCSICNLELSSKCALNNHMKRHNGVKKYTCSIENCNKKFLWKQTLERHMDLHSDEKKFLCYLCGKVYSAYDSLRFHLKSHKDERPHVCVQCGKTFRQACHLKCHTWSHNGIKPYVCKICNKAYARSRPLKIHMEKYCGIGKNPP